MPQQKIIDGNTAVAEAMRQINPDVVGAYPITPTSHVHEQFAEFVAKKKVDTEMVLAESEHSSMSICVGAAASGGRAMTATSSQGLSLMNEVLFNASGMRLPIILINGNRTLSAPLSIHCDHSDIMSARDTGWIQLHAKNAQEAYDLPIQAIRIAEHPDVRTPVMVSMDGFQVTHTKQKIQVEDDKKIQEFIGKPIQINSLLDTNNPVTYGAAVKPDYFMECKRSQLEGMLNAQKIMPKIGREFTKKFGRDYTESGEEFMLNDAEFAIICLGSIYGTVCEGVKELRKKGIKIGAFSLRTFRPFPKKYVQKKLKNLQKIAILERTYSAGAAGGPLYSEIRSALYDTNNKPKIIPFVTSLGGREFYPHNVEEILDILKNKNNTNSIESNWINLRN